MQTFSVKHSESDDELAGCNAGGSGGLRRGIPPQCTQAAPETGWSGGSGPANAQFYIAAAAAAAAVWLSMYPASFPPSINPFNRGHEQRLALEAQLFSCMQN